MDKCQFHFRARATGPDLRMIVRFDTVTVFDAVLGQDFCDMSYEFQDDESQHCIEIEMQGKLPEHTVINDTGQILQDRVIELRDFRMDDIPLEHDYIDLMTYQHDFNGTQSSGQHKFYGDMGCNGTVKLEFTTPIYLWILEHA